MDSVALKRFCDKCGEEVRYNTNETVIKSDLKPCFDVKVILGSCIANRTWCIDCCNTVMPNETYQDRYPDKEAYQTLAEKMGEIIREIVREEIQEQ